MEISVNSQCVSELLKQMSAFTLDGIEISPNITFRKNIDGKITACLNVVGGCKSSLVGSQIEISMDEPNGL